jgi:NtrC-family two-component system sensor histidine kinase KinB
MFFLKKIKLRIFHKFLLVVVISAVIPIFISGIVLINKFQFSLETPISELHINLAEGIKNKIEREMAKFDRDALFLSEIIHKMDQNSRQSVMLSYINNEPLLKEISLVNPKGLELIKINLLSEKTQELGNISGKDYFKEALEKGNRVIKILKEENSIILLYPFKDFSIKFVIDKKVFFDLIELSNIGSDGVSILIDENANILASSNSEIETENVSKWEITKQALKNLSSAIMTFKDSGKSFIGAYSYVPSLKGAVIIRQSKSDAYQYAMSMKKEALYILFSFILIVIISGYIISKNMSVPILKIAQAAKKVSLGNFDHKVEVNTNDELKMLADTFNEMIWQLKLYSDMQIEKILRERENTQAVLFSTEDGIIMVDMEFSLKLINRKAISILNISENHENANLLSLIKDENIYKVFKELLAEKKENSPKEFVLESDKSKMVFKAVLKNMMSHDRQNQIGYLIAIYDITLDKELNRMKEEFLHSITHDMRNPMGAIKGFIEFLLKEIPGPLNEAQKKMLLSMDRAAFRLLGMINNILDIAKMEAGKMILNLSEFNIVEVARRSMELMESLTQKKNISMELIAPQELKLNADMALIERIFINLIGNAIKFTGENGKIMVGLEKKDKYIYGWVEDTGEGLPLDYVEKVFEKFEQVKGQKAGGTGLGLTICKYITKTHLGDIWAEQYPKRGARFVFKIPLGLTKNEDGGIYIDESKIV